jgi:hypothetical protein
MLHDASGSTDYTHPSRGRLRLSESWCAQAVPSVTSQIPGTDRAHTIVLVVLPFRAVVSIELKKLAQSIPAPGAAQALAQAVVYDNIMFYDSCAACTNSCLRKSRVAGAQSRSLPVQ